VQALDLVGVDLDGEGESPCVVMDGAALKLIDVNLTRCVAALEGGAIRLDDAASSLIYERGTISDSEADFGGALHCADCQSIGLFDVNFVNNDALFDGGAVFVGGNADLFAAGVYFEGNVATRQGGSVFVPPDLFAQTALTFVDTDFVAPAQGVGGLAPAVSLANGVHLFERVAFAGFVQGVAGQPMPTGYLYRVNDAEVTLIDSSLPANGGVPIRLEDGALFVNVSRLGNSSSVVEVHGNSELNSQSTTWDWYGANNHTIVYDLAFVPDYTYSRMGVSSFSCNGLGVLFSCI
jgi:hypothetical protein